MSTTLDYAVRGSVYLFELIVFVMITRKCFWEKYSVGKVVGIVLFSPVCGVIVSNVIALDLLDVTNLIGEQSTVDIVLYSAAFSALQTVIAFLFLAGYVKFVKAKNPSIALFVFLCYYLLIPNFLFVSLLIHPILCYSVQVILVLLFYLILIRPLSKLTKTRIVTDTRLFVLLPALSSIYHAVVVAVLMIMYIRETMTNDDIKLLGNALKQVVTEENSEYFRSLLHGVFDNSAGNFSDMLFYSVLFIALILIIAFYVIVKNMEYMNETIKAKDKIHELSVEVMEALARTIDAKDQYTRGHSTRVAKYARMIAEKMGLDKEQQENIYYMGLLHDIGKIAVPREIINKPARLSEHEYKIIQTHPVKGYEILSEIKSRPDLATGARWHHERMDGKGYPERLKGDAIPLEARIIAVADSYDAMTSNRSYRGYLPQEKVRDELLKNIGTQFDEISVKCMVEIIDQDKEYTLHE